MILDCALKLLIENGDAGLTLRKIADCCEMRLSNVQYYFKSRDDVLVAMIERYFDECAQSMLELMKRNNAQTQREKISYLVSAGLAHGHDISDMCRAFREIWAISSRNEVIDECLLRYYTRFSEIIEDYAFGDEILPARRKKITALLIPYFEGYSVSGRSIDMDLDAASEYLTSIAMSTLALEFDD